MGGERVAVYAASAWQSAHQEQAARALADLKQAQIADLIEALDHGLGMAAHSITTSSS